MDNYQWNDAYSLGVEVIDAGHKRLLSVCQRVIKMLEGGDYEMHRYACIEAVKFFKSHLITHCAEEEEYMRSIDYEHYEWHKELHDRTTHKLIPSVEKDLIESDYDEESIRRFVGIGLGWFTAHLGDDLAIVGRGVDRSRVLSERGVVAKLAEGVSEVMKGVFQMPAELVNDQYEGEDFGEALYYDIGYKSIMDEGYVRLIVSLEKRLVLQGTGVLLSTSFQEIDTMVLSATKELSNMMFQHMRGYFPSESARYQFAGDQLLTAEQVRLRLAKKAPDYGLLFKTPMGFFAICLDMGEAKIK